MDIVTGLIVITLIYGALYFFDTFFKTCAHYPYIQFLKGTGFEIKLLQLRWTTTAFNRIFVRWGSGYTKFFNLWFFLGLHITLILFPVSICLLLYAIIQNFIPKTSGNVQNIVVEPIIPGINLPASELGYYSLSLIISSIVHEAGHALACVKEDVHLSSVGINILFILPIAYVNISCDKLNSLNPWRALRILCAGIWHNIVLAALAFLLYLSIPYLFSTCFYTNNGIWVADIMKNSPLYGIKGLKTGDTITKINDCVVHNDNQWFDCLYIMLTKKPGYCIDADLIHTLDESIPLKHISNDAYDCCPQNKKESICFEYLDNNDGILELPPHVCLPARTIVESSPYLCNSVDRNCPQNLHCFRPMLQNGTNLFKIKRVDKADVIYIGHSVDFVHTMRVSPYIPKYFFNTTTVPDVIMKFLLYVCLFSLGLALVNVIPCFFMDGQHITTSIVQIILAKYFNSTQSVSFVSIVICFFGTVLLVFHCVYTIWNKIFL